MGSPSQPPASGGGPGRQPPDLAGRVAAGEGVAAVGGAIAGLALSELVALEVPVDRLSWQLLGLTALVALQVGWSWWQRSRGRSTPLLVFCEATIAFCLGRLLADGFQALR